MRVGTPPVLQLSALEKALEAWDDVDMQELRRASLELSELFIAQVEARCPDLQLASPRNGAERGSQVSFSHPKGYAIVQALIAQDVIGDFRAPNIMRFGFTPLYLDKADVICATEILEHVMNDRLWDRPEFKITRRVT